MQKQLSSLQKTVVHNLRHQLGDDVKVYPDHFLAGVWKEFSASEHYPDMRIFLSWLSE